MGAWGVRIRRKDFLLSGNRPRLGRIQQRLASVRLPKKPRREIGPSIHLYEGQQTELTRGLYGFKILSCGGYLRSLSEILDGRADPLCSYLC